MEKRKEFAEGEPIGCPKCGSYDVDYDSAPESAVCNLCKQKFSIRSVVIWDDPKYKDIEGQCGTCQFADCFDYGPGPSDSEDGVHCTSQEHAKALDDAMGYVRGTQISHQAMFERLGYLDIFRLETLVEEDYRCKEWKASQRWELVKS